MVSATVFHHSLFEGPILIPVCLPAVVAYGAVRQATTWLAPVPAKSRAGWQACL